MMHLLDDPYLKPYGAAIRGRAAHAAARARELACGRPLAAWADAHTYFGLHRIRGGWVFREWAPHATSMWLVGDFSAWRIDPAYELFRIPNTDVWERRLPAKAIHKGDKFHLEMRWEGGRGERIPAYARYVTQDPETKLFSAEVYETSYQWKNKGPDRGRSGYKSGVDFAERPDRGRSGYRSGVDFAERPDRGRSGYKSGVDFAERPDRGRSGYRSAAPFIYEAHVGMAGEEPRVHSYAEFRDQMLPRIKAAGYDTVQLMGVMEHPYYGSFGYHVSSFFAPSSRFGTPDDLKSLIDTAHGLGLRVIMDLVHSHAVANERDGLSRFDGTDYQYFHGGAKGWHSAWGSRCFDYGKPDVLYFLLSNCRYWLEEFHFDGYRFDGVTSMLFWDHGLGRAFTDYAQYFDGSMDDDAWCYLALANRVIHETNPAAITIAEDVSGMPGVASPIADCGIGFDYRMAMGEPDAWFRLAEKVRDEDWSPGAIYHFLTDRRAEEKVVSYVESHDQALVGGKTFFFQLVDAAIYDGMRADQENAVIDRGLALHKMARLATLALSGGAYLNFMGNEFGHPEWIDFPRAENGWDYAHARRQWSLRDDPSLRFRFLGDFDAAMTQLLRAARAPLTGAALAAVPAKLEAREGDQVLAFARGELVFVFNFNPTQSFTGYGVMVPPGSDWRHVFDTDEPRFGGQGRIQPGAVYAPTLVPDDKRREIVQQIRLYLPARTAVVLRRA